MLAPLTTAERLRDHLAALAWDRADDLARPVIAGIRYLAPATRADAERAARELESAATLWRGICARSVGQCLAQAHALRTGPTLA